MIESGNYPPGTEFDPRAPWNEVEQPDHTFDCVVSQTLTKDSSITTNNYVCESDEFGDVYYDNSFIEWNEEYKEQHLTPLDLIKNFAFLLQSNLLKGYYENDKEKKHFEYLIDECLGWENVELEVESN